MTTARINAVINPRPMMGFWLNVTVSEIVEVREATSIWIAFGTGFPLNGLRPEAVTLNARAWPPTICAFGGSISYLRTRPLSEAATLIPVLRLPRFVAVTTKVVLRPLFTTRGVTERWTSSNGATWISAMRLPIIPISSRISIGSW